MTRYLRIAAVLILAVTIILSCTLVGNRMTDPATFTHTIEVLDKNRSTLLSLSAAAAAASAAVSALPSDICTPLAQQLSEFTTWFLLILCIIFLEKYLLTIFGAVACYLLIPIGCGALLTNCYFPNGFVRSIGTKLLAFGAALLLVIPTSVWVSDQINAIYSKSIEITVESANTVSGNLIGEMSNGDETNSTVIDEAKAILDDITSSVAGVIEQFKNVLNRFIEATAVMLVTTCLIPILVCLFFIWIVKMIFNVQVVVPTQLLAPKKKGRSHHSEHELLEDGNN